MSEQPLPSQILFVERVRHCSDILPILALRVRLTYVTRMAPDLYRPRTSLSASHTTKIYWVMEVEIAVGKPEELFESEYQPQPWRTHLLLGRIS